MFRFFRITSYNVCYTKLLRLLTTARYTYVAYVDQDESEGVAINPWTWPDLDDYQDLPVFVSVRAYEPGDWAVHLACE